MNYFGHAAVSTWQVPGIPDNARGGLPFGAMLPDFQTMCGARVADTTDPDVQAGIDLHHATDKAFHTLPAVVGLMRELDARLARGGCAKGPRRAVSHIGVELLLDGVLLEVAAYREAYILGIEYDAPITWRDPDDDVRFEALQMRLRAQGAPDDLRRPDAIAFRLGRMLAHRPLLAPSPQDNSTIVVALIEHKPRIEVAADTVMRGMRAALQATTPRPTTAPLE